MQPGPVSAAAASFNLRGDSESAHEPHFTLTLRHKRLESVSYPKHDSHIWSPKLSALSHAFYSWFGLVQGFMTFPRIVEGNVF